MKIKIDYKGTGERALSRKIADLSNQYFFEIDDGAYVDASYDGKHYNYSLKDANDFVIYSGEPKEFAQWLQDRLELEHDKAQAEFGIDETDYETKVTDQLQQIIDLIGEINRSIKNG